MATDIAMDDIDMDLDMDPEVARLYAEAEAIDKRSLEARAAWNVAPEAESMAGVEDAAEEGEVLSDDLAPTKVHVRGVDQFNTFDIEGWATEHFSLEFFAKVQWIDDSSANIIYDTEAAAADALLAFSAEHVTDMRQLRPAKGFSKYPDQQLHVRQGLTSDVKAPEAKERSRFYLLNKEWDPDNPDNIRPDNRKRRWIKDGRGEGKYRRRDYESRPRRTSREEQQQFHESMYDDTPQSAEAPRRNSYSSGSEHGRRRVTFNRDLIAGNRETGRLRERSASPTRDGDGRYGFDELHERRRTARARSRTPPGVRRGRDNTNARDDLRKELFPAKRESTALTSNDTNGSSHDLFDHRAKPSISSRDLFPEKVNGAVHRRQKAKSLTPSEVADAIGRQATDAHDGSGGRDLFSRISGGPKVEPSFGRLRDLEPSPEEFSIKGAARSPAANGFSFLGASKAQELFPSKAAGNGVGGKDLFEGRLKGRGAPRKRAEDLF